MNAVIGEIKYELLTETEKKKSEDFRKRICAGGNALEVWRCAPTMIKRPGLGKIEFKAKWKAVSSGLAVAKKWTKAHLDTSSPVNSNRLCGMRHAAMSILYGSR